MGRRLVLPASACAALGLAGCAPIAGDSSATRAAGPPARIARAESTHEYPTPVPHQTVIGGWRNPAQAVAVFADTYINWTAATVSARLRALAQVSVGQARSAMLLTASETAQDYELHRGGVVNRGTVEAVAPLPSASHTYVVVTRQQTGSTVAGADRGLAPAWHVTLATVARVGTGLWVLSRWQSES